METKKIQKWGNSFAIRLPVSFCKRIGITEDTVVNIIQEDDRIIIEKPKYTLSELLEGITDENMHGEYDTGEAVGKEVW
jgi:antitoxin MazE